MDAPTVSHRPPHRESDPVRSGYGTTRQLSRGLKEVVVSITNETQTSAVIDDELETAILRLVMNGSLRQGDDVHVLLQDALSEDADISAALERLSLA